MMAPRTTPQMSARLHLIHSAVHFLHPDPALMEIAMTSAARSTGGSYESVTQSRHPWRAVEMLLWCAADAVLSLYQPMADRVPTARLMSTKISLFWTQAPIAMPLAINACYLIAAPSTFRQRPQMAAKFAYLKKGT